MFRKIIHAIILIATLIFVGLTAQTETREIRIYVDNIVGDEKYIIDEDGNVWVCSPEICVDIGQED